MKNNYEYRKKSKLKRQKYILKIVKNEKIHSQINSNIALKIILMHFKDKKTTY